MKREYDIFSLKEFDVNQIHERNKKNATVMLSGGLDSAVALWWALDHYENIKALTVDYNQPHVLEVEHANQLAKLTGINHQIIKVDFPLDFWGLENHLTRGQACLMTSLAAIDISHDGLDIVMGILKTDMYGDCNRSFLDSLAEVLFHPNDWNPIGIATPLRAVEDKTDVIAWGYQLGVPANLTWTCRDPLDGKPCHKCMQCQQRDSAYNEFFKRYKINKEDYNDWNSVLGSPYHPFFHDASRDLEVIIKAFLQAGAFKTGIDCYCYDAPDGTRRVSSHIKSIRDLEIPSSHSLIKAVAVHGFLNDGYRWEVCLCADGTVAYTDRLPSSSVIEAALIKKAEL